MKEDKIWRDIETEETFTYSEIRSEFDMQRKSKLTEAESLEEYLENCSTRRNGTLERINNHG